MANLSMHFNLMTVERYLLAHIEDPALGINFLRGNSLNIYGLY